MQKSILYIFLFINDVEAARSLHGVATSLSSHTIKIGLALSTFGIAFGAICLILGRDDARMRINSALSGFILLLIVGSLIAFFKGIV